MSDQVMTGVLSVAWVLPSAIGSVAFVLYQSKGSKPLPVPWAIVFIVLFIGVVALTAGLAAEGATRYGTGDHPLFGVYIFGLIVSTIVGGYMILWSIFDD
jgi:hypothetical protein